MATQTCHDCDARLASTGNFCEPCQHFYCETHMEEHSATFECRQCEHKHCISQQGTTGEVCLDCQGSQACSGIASLLLAKVKEPIGEPVKKKVVKKVAAKKVTSPVKKPTSEE